MMGGDFIMSSGSVAAATEPWKSTAIKGMLEKNDLAEAYNCDIKRKGKVRKHSKGAENTTQIRRVKAVEFREAFVEDILMPNDSSPDSEKKNNSLSERRFIEAIKVISQPNLLEVNNNIDHNSRESCGDSVKSMYTPQCVRRANTTEKKPPALRRRSALDLPSVQTDVTDSGYEPENSLCRVRKKSEGNLSQNTSRRRRSGLDTVKTQHTALKESEKVRRASSPAYASLAGSRQSLESVSSGEGSPPSRRSASRKAPLFALSIPEHSEIKSETSSVTLSPQLQRKSLTDRLRKIKSEASFSPLIQRRKVSNSTNRQLSYPPLNERISPSQSISSLSDISCASGLVSPNGTSQESTSRYWDWYVTTASYSWQNFNTDKHLCY